MKKVKKMIGLLAAVASVLFCSCVQQQQYGYGGQCDSKGYIVQGGASAPQCSPGRASCSGSSSSSVSVGVGLSGNFPQPIIYGGSCPQGQRVYQQQQVIYQGGQQRYERCSSGWRPCYNGGYQRCQPTRQYPQGYRPYCPPSRVYQQQNNNYNNNYVVGYHPQRPQRPPHCPPGGWNTGGTTYYVNHGEGRQGGGGRNTTYVTNNGQGRQGGGGRNTTYVTNTGQGRNRRN